MSQESNKPVHKLRMGKISASIWQYEVGEQKLIRHGVTFQKSYLNKNEQWENTTIFNRDELLVVAKLADHAHSWIYDQREEKKEVMPKPAPEPEAEIPF